MKTKQLQKLDRTSILGYGCMRFPTNSDGSIHEEESMRLLNYAYAHGVTYYDTAYLYHHEASEAFLGRFMQTKDRSTLYVATKLPVFKVTRKEDVRVLFEEQLQRLQVSYIDYYLLHALSNERFDMVERYDILAVMEELKQEGKIRHLGFSFHDQYAAFERIIKAYAWDFCQLQINYMDMNIQAGKKGLDLAAAMQIPVLVMEPIKGGSLANPGEEVTDLLHAVHPTWTPAEFALRYAASYENVQVILSGMSTFAQVEENTIIFADFTPFAKSDWQLAMRIEETLKKKIGVPCTACAYCMPCPHGVDIPGSFKVYNDGYRYNNFKANRFSFSELKGKPAQCVSCRVCVSQCPQQINIPLALQKVDEEYSK